MTSLRAIKKFYAWALFFITFAFYIFTAAPVVQPYRDTGELAVVCKTLSVAHPPGYPAYTIIGKFFNTAVLSGNPAFRTKIMSIFFSALCIVLLWRIFLEFKLSPAGAFALCLAGIFSRVFWLLSIVCESYTPDLLFTGFLFYTAVFMKAYPKKLYLFAFVAGLALGIRPTPVLAVPCFAFIFLKKHGFAIKDYFNALLFFLLGISVYLYLPVRSGRNPPIDWADPETMSRFIYSLSRKAYGHGLDKISEFYNLNETFFRQFFIFLKNLFFQFSPLLFIFGIRGVCKGLKKNILIQAFLIFFLITGPVFLLISKMPANPHALVIVEAAYLVPFFCFFVFVGYGFRKLPDVFPVTAGLAAAVLLLFLNFPRLNNRNNFFARDWAVNVFSSTPRGSIVLFRKDVQLFSVWYENIVSGKRKDSLFLAQGMMQAPWYQRQILRTGRVELPRGVYGDSFFREFINMNKKVLVTNHFEVSPDFYNDVKPVAHGILRTIGREITSEKEPVFFFSDVPCALFYDDFYRKELCDDYASAFFTEGLRCYYDGLYEKAKDLSMKGLAFNPYNADILYNLGAIYHVDGDPDEAMKFYQAAVIALGHEYRDKRTSPLINGQEARCYSNIGTICEKKGAFDDALNFYEKAVERDPGFAQGYYNIGVVYWKKKAWMKVISSFEKCLEIEPDNQQARYYLEIAKQRIKIKE
ncbi:MAG: DUF2723 domain-containing protein [bacterium]